MSQKSSLYRTIEILKHLNEGKQLCTIRLAGECRYMDEELVELVKKSNSNDGVYFV